MVDYSVSDGVATITINDPEHRNPMSVETMGDLVAATKRALSDNEVLVLVYTGAGEQAFSAGGDLSGSFVEEAIGLHRERGALADLLRAMIGGGKPTVARVNGHALAGGFGLAVACDITICVEGVKLGMTEVRVGLWPMMISAVLMRVMPRKTVLELMLTGRIIDPEEALRLGAVSKVVSRDDLDREVADVVSSLKRNSAASAVIGRDAFYGIADLDFDSALERLQTGLTTTAMTADATEGIEAFQEKRDPIWKRP